MNRRLLKQLTRLRIDEAQLLFESRAYSGAYYLAGYAIECALKACIAKRTKAFDFPDKKFVTDCHTHDLAKLIRLAELDRERDAIALTNSEFATNWATIKDWNETSRYEVTSRVKANELIQSITAPNNGILTWLQQHW